MSLHLQREIEKLKKQLLGLGALVEDNLQLAFRAVEQRDAALIAKVVECDQLVDRLEVEIEEECLKVLALHQPVAIDLRFIIAVMKINNDLERVSDHAVNITDKLRHLDGSPAGLSPADLRVIAGSALRMLKKAIDCFVNMDASRAQTVCAMDDEVDALKHRIRDQVLAAIATSPAEAESLLALLGVARNLERIADLATNIAEDVIYLVEGNIIRHAPPAP